MRQWCLPVGTTDEGVGQLDRIIQRRRRVARGESLYRMGEEFKHLYALRFGHFKVFNVNPRGEQQVSGFQMAGELLGMEAIGSGSHQGNAVALDDAEVCEIPFAGLQELFAREPTLLRQFNRILSQRIMGEQNLMLLLGGMRAEQRFAVFLTNLAARYAARGYSATRFQLRMSREDIGDHLGLTIESVSRLLSRFKAQNWLHLDKREVTLLDPAMLTALASGSAAARPM